MIYFDNYSWNSICRDILYRHDWNKIYNKYHNHINIKIKMFFIKGMIFYKSVKIKF